MLSLGLSTVESKILTTAGSKGILLQFLFMKKEMEYNSENTLVFVRMKTVKEMEIQKIRYH